MSGNTHAARAAARTDQAVRSRAGSLGRADWQRMRRTWLVPLTLLGPIGVTLLGVILFLMRGEYMLKPYHAGTQTGFQVATGELGMIQVFALGLGAALLASMIVDLEHRSDMWKATFALPVSRWRTYMVKFAWCAALLALSSALMSCGYAAIMLWQHLGPLPIRELIRIAVLTWVAVLPLVGFQLLLSSAFANQAFPLAVGILAPLFGMGMSKLPPWAPWRLMTQALVYSVGGVVPGGPGEQLTWFGSPQIVIFGIAEAALLVAIGAVLMSRREIR